MYIAILEDYFCAKISCEVKNSGDVSKCYVFNNYGSIITSIRKSTNIYKYKININRKYKVAFLRIITTAQEDFNLIGKEIYEKTIIGAPIKFMRAVVEIPDANGKKIWKEMRFDFLEDFITSCSSPNKEDKDMIIEYFNQFDELSGYPEIIGNKITVDQNGINSIVSRKLYDRLNLITYSMILDFDISELELFIHNDQKRLHCPLLSVSIDGSFLNSHTNDKPLFPLGIELD